ncbi:DnaT-like ssDNA-binding domain-containing protein [Zooshikella sp. RANM57]|uniref:DnaT-like ssDNA-binding domain-containing protein n=1 Tax=Zooshikella sp. RANM57 TaxID=3425863 RepID=UPI003D6E8D35
MSVKVSDWVFELPLTPTTKLVLLVLAYQADDEGVCWPSMSTIARRASCSIRTVRRHIRLLEEMQLLTSKSRGRSNGSRSSNEYQLVVGKTLVGSENSPDFELEPEAEQNSACSSENPDSNTPVNLTEAKSSPGHNLVRGTRSQVSGPEQSLEYISNTKTTRTCENQTQSGQPENQQRVNQNSERDPREHPIFQRGKQHDQNPSPKRSAGEPITDGWQPDWQTLEAKLHRAGIPRQFAEDQLDEFVMYWLGEGKQHPSWDAKFLTHLKRQYRYHQTQQHRAEQLENALNEKTAAQIKIINQETHAMEVNNAIKSTAYSENAVYLNRIQDTSWCEQQ